MPYFNENKIFLIFIRRMTKYLAILFLLIVLLIPALIVSYQTIRKDILSSYTDSVNRELRSLETQIHSILNIGKIISEEDTFQRLLLTVGAPRNDQYADIKAFQEKLASLAVTQEYIMDLYVLFENNPIYISNYISSDHYSSVYPTFLETGARTAAEWYTHCFSSSDTIQLQACAETYSFYSTPQNYSALTCTIPISPYTVFGRESVLVCNLNFRNIVENTVPSDIFADCFFYITDIGGQIVGTYNFTGAPVSSKSYEKDDVRYTIVSSEQSELGYRMVLGIPQNSFQGMVRSSFTIIGTYFLIGIVFIFLLSLMISLRETVFMKKVINAASLLLPFSDNSNKRFNEYTYLHSALKNSADELADLNYLAKTLALENVFLNNGCGGADVQKLLNLPFDTYCVAVIRLETEKNENQHNLFYLEGYCHANIQEPFLSAHINLDELALLLTLDDSQPCDLSRIKGELLSILNAAQKQFGENSTIHIGISMIASGWEHIREAYLQAKDTISLFADPDTSSLFLYNQPRPLILQKTLDVSLLMKCYDGILCGDQEVVEAFFQQVEKMIQKGYYDRQEPLQLLFSIRQPLYNAYLEIFAANEADRPEAPLNPPAIEYQSSLKHNVAVLQDFALHLCWQIQAQKQSRQLQLKERVLEFIRTNCFDVNFSVFSVVNEFHISENSVLQLVKETTGKSLKTYVECIRVDKAEFLLKTTQETNARIAAACGFGSENTFYRAFTRRHGVTPSKWSKNNRP